MAYSDARPMKNWLGIHWVVWCVLGLALALLIIEHFSHVLGVLPYLLVLACPLVHFFMHGKHGHEHGGTSHDAGSRGQPGTDKT